MSLFSRTALCIIGSAAVLSAAPPSLTVDVGAARHPINPWIYGINNWKDNGMQKAMRIPIVRWGGDDATSYNWQTSVKNNTGDNPWVYENYSVSPNFDAFHETNLRTGSVSLGTVSLMDWAPGTVHACSFSVAKYGKQKAVAPDDADCGNGVLLNGAQIANDPTDAYVPVTPDFAQQWVRRVMTSYGAGRAGGVRLWSLDNEPEWWFSNHIDIYPKAAGYDDMLARNITWSTAVKAVDPSALITGPVPGGWSGMLFSRIDMNSGWGKSPYQYWDNPVDQKAHGGVAWIPWYLQQMKIAETQAGHRLLDVLDVHAYIAPGSLSSSAGNAAMETLRMTSTRAFWDPNYIVPNGSIWDATGKEVAPALVPRMRQWVSDNYPGTMTGITEYSWGALNSITGAIAQADILGIFGREGLDVGTLWTTPAPTDPGAFAYRLFLNYDGSGNQFGSTSVSAVTDDPDSLSIFAAQRTDSVLTVLVLNKTSGDIATTVNLANFHPEAAAQVWQYSGANLKAITRQSDAAVSGNAVAAVFPAQSMTLFVIPQAQSAMTAPQPVISGISSAASYDAAGIAPGEIVALFGQGFGDRVLFNGVPAPIIYSLDKQMSVVVPYTVGQFAKVNVVVQNQGNPSAPMQVSVLPAHPAIFTANASGLGQGAILNVPGSAVNGPATPATRGGYIAIYATGEGLTNPPGFDGRISGTPLPAPVLPCSVNIGGQAATVQYCGAAPGLIAGVLQVNAVVPAGVSPGPAVPVTFSIGTSTSQNNVTLAVQ